MPAIILLCRGLFGKNVWTLNFRHDPLSNPLLQPNKVPNFNFFFHHPRFFSSPMSESTMKMVKTLHPQQSIQFMIKKTNHLPLIAQRMNEQRGKSTSKLRRSMMRKISVILLAVTGWS